MQKALLSAAAVAVTSSVTAAAVVTPVPTPPTLLAQRHEISLTAAGSAYQQLQDFIDAVLPALVNTFGAEPTVTLDSVLAQLPDTVLTDLLNTSGGTVSLNSLFDTLGLSTTGSSLNTAVSSAISSALTDYLSSATTGDGAAALKSLLSGAIADAVKGQLNSLKIKVKLGFITVTIGLSDIVGASGISSIANSVAGAVAGGVVDNLDSILPSVDDLTGQITAVLPDLLTTVFSAADLTDADGNFKLGNLLNLTGLSLGALSGSNALTVTSAGPLFTLARLLGGVDLGWVPGTETAIANSVNATGYLDLGTSTLKTNLADALAGALSDGSLAGDLTTVLTPTLDHVVGQIVANATSTLQADLTDALNDALGGLKYSGINVGGLLIGAISPLISGLANSLSGSLTGVVSDAVHGAVGSATGTISGALSDAVNDAIDAIPDQSIAEIRIPVVLGTGVGAFAAGAAYRDVLAKLSSQPGGADHTGAAALLGSLTVLPELLFNNAGRANGGIMARFASLYSLFGIDAVTPDVAMASSGGTPIGDTGLALGGANLVPIKVDATVEYQLQSDFAAWANPFSLMNNLAAGVLPTYMLRGLDTAGAVDQLTGTLQSVLDGVLAGNPTDTNLYLTVAAATLPLLEPMYLVGDAMDLVGLPHVGQFVDNLANAVAPALTSLVNLGYSDAYWNAETGAYERTLNAAATPVRFGTLPNIDWAQVLPNVLKQLATGFHTAFTTNTPVPNAISELKSLADGGLSGQIGKILSGLTGASADPASGPEVVRSTHQVRATVAPPAAAPSAQPDASQPVPAAAPVVDHAAATDTSTGDPSTQPPTKVQRKAPKHAGAADRAGTAADGATPNGPADSATTGRHARKDGGHAGDAAKPTAKTGDSTKHNRHEPAGGKHAA